MSEIRPDEMKGAPQSAAGADKLQRDKQDERRRDVGVKSKSWTPLLMKRSRRGRRRSAA